MREAAYRFMVAMAGNMPDFEEAIRALFAGKQERLKELIRVWPQDIQEHLTRLLERGFAIRNPTRSLAAGHRPVVRACRSLELLVRGSL